MEYFLHKDGQTLGPYDEATLRAMLAQGQILASDLIYNDQMTNWETMESVLPQIPAPVVPTPVATAPVAAAPAPIKEEKNPAKGSNFKKSIATNKAAIGTVALIIVGLLVWFFVFRGPGSPFDLDLPDHQAIETAIRKALNKPEGSLTDKDLLQVKKLNLGGQKLMDIGPLTRLTAIEELNLNENNLKNIEPLLILKSLKILKLSGNQLDDLKHIETLVAMETLDVSGNQISDISPLKAMVGLKDLRLGGNKITDVGPLENMIKIESLDAGANQISKATPFASLKSLQMLNIGNNQIKEIENFQNLKTLQILILKGNPVDANELETLKRTLKGCQIIF